MKKRNLERKFKENVKENRKICPETKRIKEPKEQIKE
jgi:hypothetical protein